MSKIKICGITRVEDALLAEALGADFIGMIFTRESKRQVVVDQAKEIASKLTSALPVGVFIEQDFDETVGIAREAGLRGVQHHALLFQKPAPFFYIHAHGVTGEVRADVFSDPAPDYILLDSHAAGQKGGTGKVFDWQYMPAHHRARIFMAGGIGAHNIAAALALKPYAVDLSSSVEESPGIKGHQKLKLLFAEIENAKN